jgi:hypothetical protein
MEYLGMIGRSIGPTVPPSVGGSHVPESSGGGAGWLQHVQGNAGERGKAFGGFGEFLLARKRPDTAGLDTPKFPAFDRLADRAPCLLTQISDAGARGLLKIRGVEGDDGAPDGFRANAYYMRAGENLNPHFVIHTASVPEFGAGVQHGKFFREIGDPRHPMGSPERNAEQEYLLQNMAKGPMYAASQIAARRGLGIAVRGIGLTAHMGIEAGAPTKAQEFKNKTSKEIDLWLCDELRWGDVGAVVHFDPRVGWSSERAAVHAMSHETPILPDEPTEQDWQDKLEWIRETRTPELMRMRSSLKMPDIEQLKETFFSRAREYREEDTAYRHGELQEHTQLEGPCIRLKARPDQNMVGDHDLFAFIEADGRIASADRVDEIQKELQESHEFQAQHGAVVYWQPQQEFHRQIKDTNMTAHSPQKGAPIVVLWPTGNVGAAYFNGRDGNVVSPWDLAEGEHWLKQTWSGQKLLEARAAEKAVDLSQPAQPDPQSPIS